MGESPERLRSTLPSDAAKATVGRVKLIQSHYWRSMLPKPIEDPSQADRLHGRRSSLRELVSSLSASPDVIRDYQSKQLYEEFKLTPLYIYRTAISKSFKNQVMARLASKILIPKDLGQVCLLSPQPKLSSQGALNCRFSRPVCVFGLILGFPTRRSSADTF